jgi:hypothetical protein
MFELHMKKTTNKLALKKSTIRVLQNNELAGVVGGASLACSQQETACGSHPPQHPPGSGNHGKPGN